MLLLSKAVIVFVVGLFASVLAGLLYGFVGHFFDLFIVFPFVVAAAIIGACSTLSKWLRFNQGALLLLIGLILGGSGYVCYLGGKYAMLVGEFTQEPLPYDLISFPFPSERLRAIAGTPIADFRHAQEATDAALQQQVGASGVVGQLLLNMREGIPWQSKRIGEGNQVFGAIVELFKLGVMVYVTGTALRDTVRVAAFLQLDGRNGRARPALNRRD